MRVLVCSARGTITISVAVTSSQHEGVESKSIVELGVGSEIYQGAWRFQHLVKCTTSAVASEKQLPLLSVRDKGGSKAGREWGRSRLEALFITGDIVGLSGSTFSVFYGKEGGGWGWRHAILLCTLVVVG